MTNHAYHDLHDIDCPLGELDDGTACRLIMAGVRGERLEVFTEGRWVATKSAWLPDAKYRLARPAPVADVIPLLAVPRKPAIVRLDGTGDLDEVCLDGVDVHIERMADNRFWIGFDHPDGTVDHVIISAKRAMVKMTFQEDC